MRRYQDPKVEVKRSAPRPYYYIRPVVPVILDSGKVERKQRAIRLGFCDEMSASEAKHAKGEKMLQVNNGSAIIQAQLQFSALIEKFLRARLPQLGDGTQSKYRQHISKHISPDLGELQMTDIDTPTIEEWLQKKTLGKAAKLDLRNIVSAIFKTAERWKIWRGPNPCEGALVVDDATPRQRQSTSAAEVMQLLDRLSGWTAVVAADPKGKNGITGPDVRLMIELQIITGFRGSEVRGLRYPDIDFANKEATCRRRWYRGSEAKPKTVASRRTRSIGPLVAALAARMAVSKDQDGWIFPCGTGNPPDDRDLQQHILRPAAEAVGCYFEGFGFHQFRRLNITWRQHAGASELEAQKAAGHASVQMTAQYTLIDAERDRRQVSKIAAKIGRSGLNVVKKAG